MKNVAAATPNIIVTTTRPKQNEQQKLHAVFSIENKSEKSTEHEKSAQETAKNVSLFEQEKMIKEIAHLFSRFYR